MDMNKLLRLLLLFCVICNGQSYTEKYSELYQRFEYFNSSGRMIGYKYYDTLYQNWKYVDMADSPSTNYISPINTTLVQKALSAKQSRLDFNVERIQTAINDIYNKVEALPADRETRDRITSFVRSAVATINGKSLDYSSNNITLQVINYLYGSANDAIKLENNRKPPHVQLVEKSKDDVPAFMHYKGGYEVPLVKEYEYRNSDWKEIMVDRGTNYLYYEGDMIWVKRGLNNWVFRNLNFKQYNPLLKMYSYTSPWGDIYIGEDFKVAVFLDNDGDKLYKKYEYFIGDFSSSIIPSDK
jgi:hypothetical protein